MDLLKIEVNGKEYTMAIPKARMWREWMKFDQDKPNIKAEDFIDRHAEMIASVFPELTADEILDNAKLDDIILTYNLCLKALMKMLSAKMELLAKNEATVKSQN